MIDLIVLFISVKLVELLLRPLGQPPLVGQIVGGILVGPSLLNWLSPSETLELFSELGIVMLLFWVGLEMHFEDLLATRKVAIRAGTFGAILPFFGGLLLALLIGEEFTTATFFGAALVATSVGVTAAVLKQFGLLKSTRGKTILGAAVIDDIIAIAMLAAVAIATGGGGNSSEHLLWTVAALVAFFIGVTFSELRKRDPVERLTKPFYLLLTPLFFGVIGVKFDLNELVDIDTLYLLTLTTVVAVLTKYVGVRFGADTLRKAQARFVAIGMIPRGEVGVVVASIGLATAVFDQQLFTTVVGMSLLTTVFVPTVLKKFKSTAT